MPPFPIASAFRLIQTRSYLSVKQTGVGDGELVLGLLVRDDVLQEVGILPLKG